MPQTDFQRALAFTLPWEGGYSNHPNDRGGATMRGVIQRVYDAFRRRLNRATRSVRLIEDHEVEAIYEVDYWRAARCEMFPPSFATVHFDTAVNMGVGRALQFFQQVNNLPVTRTPDSATLAAMRDAERMSPPRMRAYLDRREAHYRRIVEKDASQRVFLKGWLNRLNSLRERVGVEVTAENRKLG